MNTMQGNDGRDWRKRSPKVAIVVLCYNNEHLVRDLLTTNIQNTTYENAEYVIVDNNSNDQTVEFAKKQFPNIKIIRFEKNHGFAKGYDLALNDIQADFYVLLSSDVEVSKGWLTKLIDLAEDDKSIAVCQPKVKSYYKKSHFEYAGASGGFVDMLGIPFARGRLFNTVEPDLGQYNSTTDIFWASGCCFLIRADVYHQAGGLDHDFFAHMEEIDLCWRIKNLGYKIKACPEAEVYHMGGETLNYHNPQKLFLNYRNNYAMLTKNVPKGRLFSLLMIRFMFDWIASVYFLSTRGLAAFFSIYRAQWSFISNFRYWLSKRTKSQKQPQKLYNKVIAFEYFVRRRKRYSDLNTA